MRDQEKGEFEKVLNQAIQKFEFAILPPWEHPCLPFRPKAVMQASKFLG